MSSKYRDRVAEHPGSLAGAVGGILVTLGLLVVLRVAVAPFINDVVHPITYLAVAGGGLGSVAMVVFAMWTGDTHRFAPVEFWAKRIGEGDVTQYQGQGLYLHVTYGAVLAAFYPRIMIELTGDGGLFAALPLSLLTATLFGLVLFVLGIGYSRAGLFELPFEPRTTVLRFLAMHIVYGLVLGLTTGLMKPVLKPLLGI